jgi:hypothetical protein
VMRRALQRDLAPVSATGPQAPVERRPNCRYDPAALPPADSLRARIYACYTWAQNHVVVGTDTLDRLSVYGELARARSQQERRRLFLALDPVWRSINGENLPASPYRRLIALDATRGGGLPAARFPPRARRALPACLPIRWSRGCSRSWPPGARSRRIP